MVKLLSRKRHNSKQRSLHQIHKAKTTATRMYRKKPNDNSLSFNSLPLIKRYWKHNLSAAKNYQNLGLVSDVSSITELSIRGKSHDRYEKYHIYKQQQQQQEQDEEEEEHHDDNDDENEMNDENDDDNKNDSNNDEISVDEVDTEDENVSEEDEHIDDNADDSISDDNDDTVSHRGNKRASSNNRSQARAVIGAELDRISSIPKASKLQLNGLSLLERTRFSALKQKYQDNYERMSRDIRINQDQLTPAELKKKFEIFNRVYHDNGSKKKQK